MNAVEILLVEDSPYDAELMVRALKKNNLANHIVHLKDGAEALDFLFATGAYSQRDTAAKPKVIFLDLKMPKVSGLEVLRKLKADDRTRTIPVVVMTSSKEEPDVEESYRLGVNSYVVKPVDFEKFLQAATQAGFYWLMLNQLPK